MCFELVGEFFYLHEMTVHIETFVSGLKTQALICFYGLPLPCCQATRVNTLS